jgi:hypothetical protein
MPVQPVHETGFEHGRLITVQGNVIVDVPGYHPIQMWINKSGAAAENQNQANRDADQFFHRVNIIMGKAFAIVSCGPFQFMIVGVVCHPIEGPVFD